LFKTLYKKKYQDYIATDGTMTDDEMEMIGKAAILG
jgi:hypothetical protein